MTGHLVRVEGEELLVDNGECSYRDVDVAAWAELAQPLNVRKVISNNAEEFSALGPLFTRSVKSRGRPATEYWLNFEQATLLVVLLRTRKSRDVRAKLIRLAKAFATGSLPAVQPLAIRVGDNPALLAQAKIDCRVAARAAGVSLARIYGFIRRAWVVPSPFAVAEHTWPEVKRNLDRIAVGQVLLPTRARILKFAPPSRQMDMFR